MAIRPSGRLLPLFIALLKGSKRCAGSSEIPRSPAVAYISHTYNGGESKIWVMKIKIHAKKMGENAKILNVFLVCDIILQNRPS
jgi:hypothetical protein